MIADFLVSGAGEKSKPSISPLSALMLERSRRFSESWGRSTPLFLRRPSALVSLTKTMKNIIASILVIIASTAASSFAGPLVSGDISILGFNTLSAGSQSLSFATWNTITAGQKINFACSVLYESDAYAARAWGLPATNLEWAATRDYSPGEVVSLDWTISGLGSAGFIVFSFTGNPLSFSGSPLRATMDESNILLNGFAYRGSSNAAGWVSTGIPLPTRSYVPTVLSLPGDTTSIPGGIVGIVAGQYTGSRSFDDIYSARLAVSDSANWSLSSSAVSYDLNTFAIPEPNTAILAFLGIGFVLYRIRGKARRWE